MVGSGPGCLDNAVGFVDGHDVVVRVNNYKTGQGQGKRCDVFYSFFGTSIRKRASVLMRDGVKLCITKCPDAKVLDSEWHERNGKTRGVDFRMIHAERRAWWFCPTYVPSVAEFREGFDLLGGHVPTTGFAAILTVLACDPASLYVTGFDFFSSGVHNVNERWKPGDPEDPIGHVPEAEMAWVVENRDRMQFDRHLTRLIRRSSK